LIHHKHWCRVASKPSKELEKLLTFRLSVELCVFFAKVTLTCQRLSQRWKLVRSSIVLYTAKRTHNLSLKFRFQVQFAM
jgi:hypothetical protein